MKKGEKPWKIVGGCWDRFTHLDNRDLGRTLIFISFFTAPVLGGAIALILDYFATR